MVGTQGRIPGKVHVLSTVEEVEALEVADPGKLAYVTQTTLSVDDTRDAIEALTRRFPDIQGPDVNDICYATQNRQNAVKEMLPDVQLLLVVGSANSSNSNRLRELGERHGVPSYLVDHPDQIREEWVTDVTEVGVTAGASAPESLVKLVLERLMEMGVGECHELPGKLETVVFQMPAELN
jgi:4-hydroxy-3-methylbut-2-enyl diphosphate reductase